MWCSVVTLHCTVQDHTVVWELLDDRVGSLEPLLVPFQLIEFLREPRGRARKYRAFRTHSSSVLVLGGVVHCSAASYH